MFNLLKKIKCKYKKINLTYDFGKIDKFCSDIKRCNLYRAGENPLYNDVDEDIIAVNEKFDKLQNRIFVGNRSFDLNPFTNKNVAVFLGEDLIVRMPTGYSGGKIYYRIKKLNE